MSSRTSFAVGGFIAAFLMGVLLVASLSCEGGSPSAGSEGCADFVSKYVIASLDGDVIADVSEQTGTVTAGATPMTTTLPATITDPADANIVTLAFVLENSSAKTNCSKVRLGAPDGTTFELIFDFGYNFSHKSLEMFDVTSFYQTHGKGSYSIEVTTDDGTFSAGCVGTTTTLSDAWLSVSDTTTYGPCSQSPWWDAGRFCLRLLGNA
jgi:hypothetical protein